MKDASWAPFQPRGYRQPTAGTAFHKVAVVLTQVLMLDQQALSFPQGATSLDPCFGFFETMSHCVAKAALGLTM